jgi:DtxR family manganese transport transcriptional regulator
LRQARLDAAVRRRYAGARVKPSSIMWQPVSGKVELSAQKTNLQKAKEQAAGFDRIRDDHRSEIAEDYVELIADLIDAKGEARAVDLAERLGVTNATVNNTIGKLQREGLVRSEPYRSIFLTDTGEALAEACRERHRIVLDFLNVIGVPPEVAATDAEGIEHHVSKETLNALETLTRDLRGRDRG